jgi:hypothetical protein
VENIGAAMNISVQIALAVLLAFALAVLSFIAASAVNSGLS